MTRAALLTYSATAVSARTADVGAITGLVLFALERTGRPDVGGLLVAAASVPHVVAGPVAGVLADRARSPKLLYSAAFLVFALGMVGVERSLGSTPLVLPLACAFLCGLAGPLLSGGLSGVLSGLVPPAGLPRAYGVDSGTYNLASIIGPALVAAVSGVASAATALLAVAALAVLGAGLFWLIPVAATARSERVALRPSAVLDGVRIMVRHPQLRGSTVATTLNDMGVGGMMPLATALVAVELGLSTDAGASLMAVFGVGALLGSLTVVAVPIRTGRASLALYASLAVSAVLFVAAGIVPAFAAVVIFVGLAGASMAIQLTATFIIRADNSPPHLRTQVFATAAGFKYSAAALGASVGGFAAEWLGGGGLFVVVAAIALTAVPAGLLASRSRGQGRTRRGRPRVPVSRTEPCS